jgi:hypothetical protein
MTIRPNLFNRFDQKIGFTSMAQRLWQDKAGLPDSARLHSESLKIWAERCLRRIAAGVAFVPSMQEKPHRDMSHVLKSVVASLLLLPLTVTADTQTGAEPFGGWQFVQCAAREAVDPQT